MLSVKMAEKAETCSRASVINVSMIHRCVSCEIVGFRGGLPDLCRLLGCYAAWVGFVSTFRDYVSVPISKGQAVHEHILTLEDNADT
jgi:hypothetical protein